VTRQSHTLINVVAAGNQVAVEARWTATLAVPFGNIPAGGEMRARFAIFLEFRDGLIVRQRNYDCFDPF
jgi:ketosteroid isomerase-like protein